MARAANRKGTRAAAASFALAALLLAVLPQSAPGEVRRVARPAVEAVARARRVN